jgi:hypothetical protein
MSWRRLPSFLPNLPIRLLPFSEAQQKEFEATGHLRTVAFRTIPSLGKVTRHAMQADTGAFAHHGAASRLLSVR